MEEKEETTKLPPKEYQYSDLLKFEQPNLYSSFGRMKTSEKPTAPKFGFGTATRNKQSKAYVNKPLSKTQFWGKASPGPMYNVRGTDTYAYQKPPDWKIGTEIRNTLNTGAKYDHYNRQDVDYHPDVADKGRRTADPKYGFNLESRFPNDPKRHKATPGPQYNPPHRQDIKEPSKYSFGFRRQIQGASPLVANSSTPNVVGPGAYIQKNVPKTSQIEDEPHWSFGKGPKLHKYHPGWDKHQTYDTKTRAIGNQLRSQKKTLPKFSFGKANRNIRTGVFKDHMQNPPTSVKIAMPKF